MHNLLHIIFVNMSHTAVVSSEVCNLNGTLFLEETAFWKGKDSPSSFYAAIFTQWNVWTGYHKSKNHPSVNTHHILSTEPHILNPSIECCFWCSKWNSEMLSPLLKATQTHKGRKYKSPVCPLFITCVLPLVWTSRKHVMRMWPVYYEVLNPTLITFRCLLHFIIIRTPSTHIHK